MPKSFLDDTSSKNATTKREIIRLCIVNNTHSIADFSKSLGLSVPTTTKFVGELIEEGFLQDEGKIGTSGGRRPNIYGLNPDAGYFVGVDVARRHVHLAVCNFKGEMIHFIQDIEFVLEASEESFRNICKVIKDEVTGIGISWDKVLGIGVSLSGRVNPEKGYSLSYFVSEDIPLTAAFTRELGVPVSIENDSRAMTYGEYMTLGPEAGKDFIFVNLSWGLGMGLILDGNLYYGKSGFSGEIGHFPLLDNNIICRCGKVGCLETGASGSALHRMGIDYRDPQNEYNLLLQDFLDMSEALLPCQRTDGMWNVSLLSPTTYGGPEASGTSLFLYGMAWGMRMGILSPETYRTPADKAWQSLAQQCVHPNGFLGYVQGTGKAMMYMMPLMTLWMGFVLPGALSIYWAAQAAFSVVQEKVLNKYFGKILDQEETEKEKAAREKRMEKFQKQKEMMAQQQAQGKGKSKPQQPAKKKSTEDKRDSTNENGRVGQRPYARGRAYSEDHYKE